MTPDDRREFESLQEEQARLRSSLDRIDARLESLRNRLVAEAAPAPEAAAPTPESATPPPLPIHRQLTPAPVPAREELPAASRVDASNSTTTQQQQASSYVEDLLQEYVATQAASAQKPPVNHKTAVPAAPTTPRESLEIRLGKFWLPLAGIVIFITGLVFLGNYAWQMVVHRLGAGGKLVLLYLAGATLAGLGTWLERKLQELRSYGRVLVAGGAATIYYTTYAAHFVPSLRVIESPMIGGSLLLGLAGIFAWWADRQRSQVIAVLTILLAYYTAAINPIGSFTLFSNLLLTATAMFFLVRHRWVAVSWMALAGTYGSFLYWRWHAAVTTLGQIDARHDSVASVCMSGCYWLLFTAGVFLAARESLPPKLRIPFLTLNNGIFFGIAALEFSRSWPDSFWGFCLGYGVALLALAAVAWKRRPEEMSFDGAYLAQGLALITVGIISKVTGPQLAVILALESAVLLSGLRFRHGLLFQIAAFLTAALAFLTAFFTPYGAADAVEGRLIHATVAALLIFDAWWLKSQRQTLAAGRFEIRAALFALPGLILIGNILRNDCPDAWAPTAFALTALVCTASIYLIRLPEVALPGQAFLAGAITIWISQHHGEAAPKPWWTPLPVVVSTLALGHWWQRQRILKANAETRAGLEILWAVGSVMMGIYWIWPYYQGSALLIATTVAAMVTLTYGLATRAWAVALLGQIFLFISCSLVITALGTGHLHWAAALVPIVGLGITSLTVSSIAMNRFEAPQRPEVFNQIALIYRAAACLLFGVWGYDYLPEIWRFAFFAIVGSALLFAGALSRNRDRAWVGALFAGVGTVFFWTRFGSPAWVTDLAAIVLIPAVFRVSRRIAGETLASLEKTRAMYTGAAVASIWLWTTQWSRHHYGDAMLTVAWALLAPVIFAAGLGLKERIYRVGGFILLGLTVARVFLIDVWKLETVFRIASFLVLGIVLLAVGFVYNRYAETIRKWL